MGLSPNSTIIPGKGTVFLGAPNVAPFTRAEIALLDPGVPATYEDWDSFGHTSRDNAVAMSKEGGEVTNQGSWWDGSLEANRDNVNWGVTINALQLDLLTFQTAFPSGRVTTGGGYAVSADAGSVERAIFILMVQGTKRLGIYGPRVSLSIGDAPSIAPDSFFEIQLSGSLLSATAAAGDVQIGETVIWYPPSVLSAG